MIVTEYFRIFNKQPCEYWGQIGGVDWEKNTPTSKLISNYISTISLLLVFRTSEMNQELLTTQNVNLLINHS